MKKSLLPICLGIWVLMGACSINSTTIESPDHKLEVKFDLSVKGSKAQYCIYYEKRKVIDTSSMGLVLGKDKVLGEDVVVDKVERSSFSGSWRPVYGERNEYPDRYNQAVITLKDRNTGKRSLVITFRCYSEGVAFRYTVPARDSMQWNTISKELTGFSFPHAVNGWVSHSAQGVIRPMPLDSIKGACERPMLVEEDTGTFLALGEAALVDFARMKFTRDRRKRYSLTASLDGNVDRQGTFPTPWRYIMAASNPGALLEHNYLLLDLNKPDQLKNSSWIKPGKMIRDVTLTTRGALACIDFAASHNLQYLLFDAGWYGAENSDTSDATRVAVDPRRSKGPLDMQRVVRYGESKGVGVILYVNHLALEKQLDTLLPLYASWGIKGIKFGFVHVGSQRANTWLMAAVRKAAQYHLMVDIHDEYRPTGYSRTYPNLMTQEGVRGDEESPKNDMVLRTLFTRMIAGAADQTNCYFAPRVDEMGSHASQMAKAVCIYSPLQSLFWYDRPEGSVLHTGGAGGAASVIRETPELAFFDRLPTVWDDTKVLEGYPGKYITVARRKGSSWFIGCINGREEREFTIDLSFLPEGRQYQAVIYFDDPDRKTLTKVGISKITVNSKSVIKRRVLPENGLTVYLLPRS
jgi:alpha-glucosidase